MGLALKSCENKEELEKAVYSLAKRMSSVPKNQLWFNKLVINMVAEQMGNIKNAQTLASILDGASRHTPEGISFQKMAETYGFKKAVTQRDSGVDLNDVPFDGLGINDIKPELRSKL